MVCVPCFIIPLLLFIWHKFIQPYVLRFWNPWAVKDADGNERTEFPFKCEGGVCMFSKKNKSTIEAKPEETEETKGLNQRLKSE
ncbi:putative secreted protein [Danaus plexippus plexippus]|uniref:Secreted protein n=1 Tax=Danaus plexippus plexippus TaxID=278856 RepID=A0A212F5Y3_DANPL|nr:putative secreted protein [Danaus plexippus plexippus]